MSKNPNKRTKPARRDEPMNGAMKFFLAGCVAELYLLLIRRFYVNADSDLQRITWYDSYLWVLVGVGARFWSPAWYVPFYGGAIRSFGLAVW